MSEYRDFAPLFHADGTCVLCGQPRTIAGRDVHTELHLSEGSATVVVDRVRGVRRERVIPMPAAPIVIAAAYQPKPRDPKMRAIARKLLRKASRA